jgi:aminopeptidase N
VGASVSCRGPSVALSNTNRARRCSLPPQRGAALTKNLLLLSPLPLSQVHLTFALGDETTRVTSVLSITPDAASPPDALVLDGRADVALVSVKIDGAPHAAHELQGPDKARLSVSALPSAPFTLEVVTDIIPHANTSLEGLYVSGGMWCTQCEAEGFRGITFFPDRPDVMARYTTRIEADAKIAPVLLSNGNLVDSGPLDAGRHYAVWEDPFPKPCYLFALVAGDLTRTAGTFKTASGRSVDLHFYTAAKDAHKVGFAMESLKKAMAWDEETYGLEYDLDLFNVVAVDDFVMGAMENKSLNIFNSRLVLASPTTASDGDYARIEGVIGHEYFHNWTGNRVTCRDWFQLTLKEGLTVYRDQEFSADMNSRPVKRIEDVCRLRAAQFPEDAGAMAHPIRPESYIKMDNFYTVTVYEKGAEIVRLYETLLGKDGFRKGMDLYFSRHDGCAVTCDDFRAAMADANGADLGGFARWYEQAGTPAVTIECAHDQAAATFTVSARQATPATPGQESKGAVPIPIRVGLLGPDGSELALQLKVRRRGGREGRGGRE